MNLQLLFLISMVERKSSFTGYGSYSGPREPWGSWGLSSWPLQLLQGAQAALLQQRKRNPALHDLAVHPLRVQTLWFAEQECCSWQMNTGTEDYSQQQTETVKTQNVPHLQRLWMVTMFWNLWVACCWFMLFSDRLFAPFY